MDEKIDYFVVIAAGTYEYIDKPVGLGLVTFDRIQQKGNIVSLSQKILSRRIGPAEPYEFFEVQEVVSSPESHDFAMEAILILEKPDKNRQEKLKKNLEAAKRTIR